MANGSAGQDSPDVPPVTVEPRGPHRTGAPRCRDLFERLSEYLDGELDQAICSEMGTHLEDCPPCQAFLESLKRTIALVRRTPGAELPPEVRRALLLLYPS
jgi:RNA polymerase sigma-70 factor (ECF subfamily)